MRKKSKKIRSILFVMILSLTVVTQGASKKIKSLTLTDAGKSKYCIAIPKQASASKLWAAQELQEYIKKMTGALLPVVKMEKINLNKPAIWISQPKNNLKKIPKLSGHSFESEEFYICAYGKDIIIAGGSPRGVIYGVYELLEDVWGCHWLAPDCEIVPTYKKLTLPVNFTASGKPALEYRDVLFREAFDPIWAVRNRVPGAAYEFKRSLKDKGGRCGIWPLCHGMEYIVPFKKYRLLRPDLFGQKLEGGIEHRANCYSNPEVYRLTKEAVRKWLKSNSDAQAYDISQKDGSPDGCHCKKCQKLIDAEGSQIAPILTMANRLAKDMKKELNGKSLTIVAYNYSVKAPKKLRAEPNVVVRLCLDPTAGTPQKGSFENLQRWLEKTDRLWLWLYCNDYDKTWKPYPNVKSYAENLRYFAGLGVKGIMAQGLVKGGGDMPHLKAWLWAKIMWNPSADVDNLIDTFLNGYYGNSAKAIRKYVNIMDKAYRITNVKHEGPSYWSIRNRNFTNKKTVNKAYKYLQEATANADNDQIRKRVKIASLCIRFARMMNQISPQAVLTKDKYGFEMPAETIKEFQEWFKEIKGFGFRYSAEFEPMKTFEDSIAQAGRVYDAVTIKNDIVQLSVAPELGARIVSLKLIPDGENLLHIGSVSKKMPYDMGLSETFGRHGRSLLGDKAVYKVTKLSPSQTVLSTSLPNGEIITKIISLAENRPEVRVNIAVQNPTAKDSPVQRLHIQLCPSRDGNATRKIDYYNKDGKVKEFAVGAFKKLLLGQSNSLIKLTEKWLIKRKSAPYLVITPIGKALDMSINSGKDDLEYIRFGMGGWKVKANGGVVKMGYIISLINKEAKK